MTNIGGKYLIYSKKVERDKNKKIKKKSDIVIW